MNYIHTINETFTNGYRPDILDLFWLICVLNGISVIISKNPVISVLFLIGLFLSVALYLIILGIGFIGLSYLLVYVGAVSILFLFILMLINVRISELYTNTSNSIPLAFIIAVCFSYPLLQILPYNLSIFNNYLSHKNFLDYNYIPFFNNFSLGTKENTGICFVTTNAWDGNIGETSHITSIGNIMYTSYSLWLIITSMILLLAMVGAIVITIKLDNPPKAHAFVSLPLQSTIFKHFTPKNIIVGVMFIFISVIVRLFIIGLDLSQYPIIVKLNLSEYIDLFSNIITFISILPVYLSASGDFMGPTVLYMNAAGGNTGGDNIGIIGASNTNQAGPSTTHNQGGLYNSQQPNSYNTNPSGQTDVEVEKPKKLGATGQKRPTEFEGTTEEALNLEINNPSDQTDVRVERPKKLRVIFSERTAAAKATIEEAQNLERDNPEIANRHPAGLINPDTVTLTEANARIRYFNDKNKLAAKQAAKLAKKAIYEARYIQIRDNNESFIAERKPK